MKRTTVTTDVAIARYNENIQQIHNEFDAAPNVLLEQAKRIISETASSEKAMRLKEAGFGKAQGVRENEAQIKLRKLAEQTAKIVDYYHRKYPLYKFITEDQAMAIANKYDLYFGETSDYIGFIPEKNLKEIENFKIDPADKKIGSKMKIIAPIKDFDMAGKWLSGRKIIEDPIVIQPMKYGYVVVTKWGDEASDHILTNPIEN